VADLTISELMRAAGDGARRRGWYDVPTSLPEQLALLHSEVSEVLEDFRAGREPDSIWIDDKNKPHGIPIELADVVIKACEIADRYGIPLAAAVVTKLDWNSTRPHRHGGKRL
jgi:hypothetical protein